jgi:predicted exporter
MLCSWTSLVGYSSMLFSLNKALRSFGWYANVGELTTLATAMVFIPALALLRGRPRRAERARLSA